MSNLVITSLLWFCASYCVTSGCLALFGALSGFVDSLAGWLPEFFNALFVAVKNFFCKSVDNICIIFFPNVIVKRINKRLNAVPEKADLIFWCISNDFFAMLKRKQESGKLDKFRGYIFASPENRNLDEVCDFITEFKEFAFTSEERSRVTAYIIYVALGDYGNDLFVKLLPFGEQMIEQVLGSSPFLASLVVDAVYKKGEKASC